ncbi:MAG: thioredoxin family protein [Labilithrix sp.]|nr:thioredoxin family protein [Labilithrix sp.]MCW5811777.1 thioredoxin family protein [Labilithrix sp.]
MKPLSLALASLVVVVAACSKDPPPATQTTAAQPETETKTATNVEPKSATPAIPAVAADAPDAELGKPAPDFTLKDLDGKETKLSSFKGKVVVLEWFNPGCPFVNKSHTKGTLKEAAAKHAKSGVVWLAINSGAAGKQGAGLETNKEAVKKYAMANPVLLDEGGEVGRKYNATNTPHMFVVDANGTLVYRGAIDNSPDGEGETPTGGKLISYVDEAVAAVTAGKPVATAETKAYGCSVKYATK